MPVQTLLSDVSLRLKVCREAEQRFAHKLAPRFNLFHYLRNDELGLSRCLADLLNPDGPHGQGALFLEDFLKLLQEVDHLDPEGFVRVELERQTLKERRIDILLRFENEWIGIENKPWAMDQPQQLQDYANFLSKMASDAQSWKLVFLSEREPSNESIPSKDLAQLIEKKQFIHLDFKEIESWLRACLQKIQAPQVRVFVEELANYIREHVIGELDMTEEQEVISIIRSSDDNITAAVDIVKSWHGARDSLIKDFENRLRAEFENNENLEPVPVGEKSISSGKAYCRFDVRDIRDDLKDIRFSFSFDRQGFGQFFFGVWPKSECHPRDFEKSEDIYNCLAAEFGDSYKNRYWIWYAYGDCQKAELGDGFRNWDTSAEPWKDIRNGKLVEKFVRIAERAYHAIGKGE